MRPIVFDEIPNLLLDLIGEFSKELTDIAYLYAIRDLWGRIRFIVPCRPDPSSRLEASLGKFIVAANQSLGPHSYPPSSALLFANELELKSEVELSKLPGLKLGDGPPIARLIDRQISGAPWSTISGRHTTGNIETRRIAFYSLKGGVGRSTATAVAAWHLAKSGSTVLVLDLDLEAPGLSTSLLPVNRQPEFGIVDWFVEDAVGQGENILRGMIATSPLASDLPGSILVVPCHGREPGEYLAKLGRCYLDMVRDDGEEETWTQRMLRMVDLLETEHRPDVVLLDTRAGLSDLSAVGVTDLDADIFLFGIGTRQTWAAYRLLFDYWYHTSTILRVRDRLNVVAGLVPEIERMEYLSIYRQDSWDLFLDRVYDSVEATQLDAFSFDLEDASAPHQPVPIYWHRGVGALRDFSMLDQHLVTAAFGSFVDRLDQLTVSSESETP